MLGRPTTCNLKIVGQGSDVLAVGASMGVWTSFLSPIASLFFLYTVFRLKYCLKELLNLPSFAGQG